MNQKKPLNKSWSTNENTNKIRTYPLAQQNVKNYNEIVLVD